MYRNNVSFQTQLLWVAGNSEKGILFLFRSSRRWRAFVEFQYLGDGALSAAVRRRRAAGRGGGGDAGDSGGDAGGGGDGFVRRLDAARGAGEQVSRNGAAAVSIARRYDVLQLIQHALCAGQDTVRSATLINAHRSKCRASSPPARLSEEETKTTRLVPSSMSHSELT